MMRQTDEQTHALITAIIYAAKCKDAQHPHGQYTHTDAAREATRVMDASSCEIATANLTGVV